MKNLITLLCIFISINIFSQLTYVPDNNFEQALIDLGYDSGPLDDEVLTANISGIINLDVNNKNISDLTGIEDFTSLQYLTCFSNQLTSVDLSQNLALVNLFIYGNQLTTIDVSQNQNLTTLNCHSNLLTTLDVSQNILLQSFICRYNQLTNLDVSLNTLLFDLDFIGNQITTIDLSQNTDLTYLLCSQNDLIDLDLSSNTALIFLFCQNNQLTSLNIKNGNNTNIIVFNSQFNPNLLCINVDDVVYADANFTQIDAASSFSINCNGITYNLNVSVNGGGTVSPNSGVYIENDIIDILATPDNGWVFDNWTGDVSGNTNPLNVTMNADKNITANFSVIQTYVPDDNFEQALIDLGYDTVLDDYVPTINISSITSLFVSNKSIADLTGIEDFSSLTNLTCSYNELTSIDISQNTQLTYLECNNNLLTEIDVTLLTMLEGLKCGNNLLTYLNLSLNPALFTLFCNNNLLTRLNLLQNPNLFSLRCYTNNLTSLNLSQNANINGIECMDNQLTSLDLSQNIAVDKLRCNNNQISNLDLSQNSVLTYLECQNNDLVSLNIQNGNNTNITNFDARSNPDLICIEVDNEVYAIDNFINIDVSSGFSENCATNIFDLTIDVIGNGSTSPFGSFMILNGNEVTITATADTGWEFTNWSGDVSGNTNPLIVLMDANKNITANFSVIQTYVPDDNFEQALIDLGYDTVLDDYVPTINISSITSLFVSNKSIEDLTGIEDFSSLTNLTCSYNELTSINISQNTQLTYLECDNNLLTTLDLSQNSALTYLECQNNDLVSLNIQNGNNTNITNFDARSNLNLICIEVDNEVYAIDNFINIDVTSGFSENCATNIFDLTIDVIGNGSTSPFGSFMILNGDEVTITATADTGWEFTNWSGDASGNTNPLVVLMDANKSITANFDVVVGVNDFQNLNFSISPNPVKDIIHIDTSSNIEKIWVYNMLGQQIITTTKKDIKVSKLNAGVYIVKFLTTKNQVATKRFIKQ